MNAEIALARPDEEEALQAIFVAAGMDLAGEIEQHAVLRRDGKIVAGAMLYEAADDTYQLVVIAVAAAERGRGTGQLLLAALAERPWEYCLGAAAPAGRSFAVTTVARGSARRFYERCGFATCDYSVLPPPFDSQCDDCPDRGDCGPAAMILRGEAE